MYNRLSRSSGATQKKGKKKKNPAAGHETLIQKIATKEKEKRKKKKNAVYGRILLLSSGPTFSFTMEPKNPHSSRLSTYNGESAQRNVRFTGSARPAAVI